jgi:hypothetical protein
MYTPSTARAKVLDHLVTLTHTPLLENQYILFLNIHLPVGKFGHIVTWRLKTGMVSQKRQPLLGNGLLKHVSAATIKLG